jgi:hypothetical protein
MASRKIHSVWGVTGGILAPVGSTDKAKISLSLSSRNRWMIIDRPRPNIQREECAFGSAYRRCAVFARRLLQPKAAPERAANAQSVVCRPLPTALPGAHPKSLGEQKELRPTMGSLVIACARGTERNDWRPAASTLRRRPLMRVAALAGLVFLTQTGKLLHWVWVRRAMVVGRQPTHAPGTWRLRSHSGGPKGWKKHVQSL